MLYQAALSLALLAGSVVAAPAATASNPCEAVYNVCASQTSHTVKDVWSHKACALAVTCFGGKRPVNEVIASLYSKFNGTGKAPTALTVDRLPQNTFYSISTDGNVITQQNWIDAFYGVLSTVGGPYPSSAQQVINYWQNIPGWTGFCPNQGVPYMNFADYYQYSPTVQGHGGSNCGGNSNPGSPPSVSSDASCQKVFETCISETDQQVSNAFSKRSCLLAASCFGGQSPVNGLLSAIYSYKNGNSGSAPTGQSEPRVDQNLFNSIAAGGNAVTQQNFIDAFYGQLSTTNGPYPANANGIISYYRRLGDWTGFCPNQGIPYQNFADYYEYSSVSQGKPGNC